MNGTRLVVFVACCASWPLGHGAFGQSGVPAEVRATALPDYSREAVVNVCLAEYGMGNSSVIDCLAEDQKRRTSLVRRWPDVDEHTRRSCLVRLADLHMTSYAYLERCVREPEPSAAPQE